MREAQCRLVVGIALLFWVMMNGNLMVAGLQVAVFMLWLRLRDQSWQLVLRAWRWLFWLLVPIFLLHACLTPGAYVLPGWPMTFEGLTQGLWYGLHLVALFFSALVVSGWLSARMWLGLLPAASGLWIYLYWLQDFREHVQEEVRPALQQWSGRRKWRDLPGLLVGLLERMLHYSDGQAHALWDDWEHAAEAGQMRHQGILWWPWLLLPVLILIYGVMA